MSKITKLLYGQKHLPSFSVLSAPILGYSLVIFLVALADAIMSYSTPIFIEKTVQNSVLMGLIIASSSFVGFWADALIGERFSKKPYYFFLFWAIILALLFPFSMFFLSPIVAFFIVSMAVWGIYFELMEFAHFHFIQEFYHTSEHAKAWGILYSFKSAAYFFGPVFASVLFSSQIKLPFIAALLIFSISLIAFLAFYKKTYKSFRQKERETVQKTSMLKELFIWKKLFHKVWPIWIFTLALSMIDAMFWTVGAVLSEEIKTVQPLGSLIIPAYIFPFLFGGFFAKQISLPFGKKRAAFSAGIFSGTLLCVAGFMPNIVLLLTAIFFAGFLASIAMPEILAVSEDYVERLREFGNTMVGLQRAAISTAYIIGPIFAGFMAELVGHQKTISVFGAVLAGISALTLIVTPRKIRMPYKKLFNVLQAAV